MFHVGDHGVSSIYIIHVKFRHASGNLICRLQLYHTVRPEGTNLVGFIL